MGLAQLRVRGQGAVQYRVLLRALGLNIHRVAAWRGSFYPQKLFGRLLSALRCHQRVPGSGKPISGSTGRRFEAPTTRVCRWLAPLLSRLFAAPSILEDRSTYFSDLIIGVHNSKYVAPSMEHLRKHCNSNLNKALGKRGLNDWWIWSQPLKSPNWNYANWTNKDTLIEMHTDLGRVVEDIGKHLLKIIKVAEPVIDEWVKENPPAQ